MSKKFLLKESGCPTPSTSKKPKKDINWVLCALCQQHRNEMLTDPTLTKRKDAGSAYKSLAESLLRMKELNELTKNIQTIKLDEGDDLKLLLLPTELGGINLVDLPSTRQRFEELRIEL